MGRTLWFFLRADDEGVRRFPLSKYLRFVDHLEPLPQFRDGPACFVEVALDLVDRRPASVLGHWFVRHLVTKKGLIDTQHKHRAGYLAMQSIYPMHRENIVDFSPYLSRREYSQHHSWRPNAAILDDVCNHVNSKATTRIIWRRGMSLEY